MRTNDYPVPGLAVGRLVETPEEIGGLIEAYVAAGGVVVPQSALVTGYDFLEDAANAVRAELAAGIGGTPDALITPYGKSPQDAASWTAGQLGTALLGSRHDVIFLAGHFSANSALAADFTTSLLTTDLAASTVNLTNAIVFSAGCHSGFNLVDGDAITGVTLPLDWAQAFARKRATLIAGTGYQYGDTDFLEYSERLYNNFARQLRAGNGAVSVGEALVKAKHDYLALTPDIRGIHEKALLEATLFGLPMLAVNMPAGRGAVPGNAGVITPTDVASGPAATLGLKIYDLNLAPVLTSHTTVLKNVQGGPDVSALWLSGPDGVVTVAAEPTLPLLAVNATPTNPSIVLRGVGFRGGSFADVSPMVPFSGAPTTELRGVHVPFLSSGFYPARPWTLNYFGALSGAGGTALLVTPAQHRAASVVNGTSTQRKFSALNLRLYYSGNLSQAALSDAPSIVGVDAQPVTGGIAFSVQVVGDPAAAIHQVWVTYTSDGVPTWASLDLVQCVAPLPAVCGTIADSRTWRGQLSGTPTNLKYVVQAASGVGLVALDDNRGEYYGVGSALQTATTLTLISPPSSATIGDTVSITAALSAGGLQVAGKTVAIVVGGSVQLGTTGNDGRVTVKVPVVMSPGNYQITGAFGGDSAYLSSSASASFTVGKAVSTLASLAPGGATLTGTLGGTTRSLEQVAITFSVTGPTGPMTLWAITDYLGRAVLPPPGLMPGIYNVTGASYAGDATYAAANVSLAQAFNVAKTAQSITFANLADAPFGFPAFSIYATASSGLPVTFNASGACSVTGNLVQSTGLGSCTVTATQPGDTFYAAAAQPRTFTITPASQVIAFAPAP
ncbi:MAG: Ig-like domain repeat protein, partial [Gammaproteobacteria bacterium]